MNQNVPFLSIVMPALNEEKNIHNAINNTLRAFDDFGINGEIIVINDGSTDRTEEIIKREMEIDERVSFIKHEAPRGIGRSYWEGVDKARGDLICMLPGDNENEPREIFRYYGLLDHVDIVIPFVYNKEVRSTFRNILSFVYRFIINSTFLVNFNYTNGTVICRKSILKELEHGSDGFFFQTDILIRAVKKGYLFAEVPYRLDLRNAGISKATSYPSLIKVVKGYFRLLKDNYYHRTNLKHIDNFTEDSMTARRYKTDNSDKM